MTHDVDDGPSREHWLKGGLDGRSSGFVPTILRWLFLRGLDGVWHGHLGATTRYRLSLSLLIVLI